MNPLSPLYREQFEAHKCVNCRAHYVTIPGSMCGFCERTLTNQARQDAIDYYMRAAGRRPGVAITVGVCRHVQTQAKPANATLDLFGC
jgi:hypothetical protein